MFVASVSCRSAGRRELGGAGRDARYASHRRIRACRRSYRGIAAARVSRLGRSVAGPGCRAWVGASRGPGRSRLCWSIAEPGAGGFGL